MNPESLQQVRLYCPVCRSVGSSGLIQHPVMLSEVFNTSGRFVTEGFLACSNSACRALFPVIEGVPIILKDLSRWWAHQREHALPVCPGKPEMGDFFRLMDRLAFSASDDHTVAGVYMDAHFGNPPPPSELQGFQNCVETYWNCLSELMNPGEHGFGTVVDLGCAVGRLTFELARISRLAVGIDLQFPMVRAAAELQRTGTVQYGRRLHGRVCETVTLRQVLPENVFFMVADALDPPFAVSSFDLVAALNLVENVAHPQVLLAQASALLKAGGTLLFGSPYEWRRELSDPGLWFETGKIGPAELTKGILEGNYYPEMELNFRITREIDSVPWPLRRHSRHWSVFLVHLLKAVKNFTGSSYCRDDATV